MVNMALDFANLKGYELQPKKSVAIHIRGSNKQCETTNEKLNMGNITMPEVEQATHLDIIKTTTMKHNIQTNVYINGWIRRAHR
jgi:GTP cyclohydrolase III